MDLLSSMNTQGVAQQLESTRLELIETKKAFKDVKDEVLVLQLENHRLRVDNERLSIENEVYKQEVLVGETTNSLGFSSIENHTTTTTTSLTTPPEKLTLAAVLTPSTSNPLSVAISSIKATSIFIGFADSTVRLLNWAVLSAVEDGAKIKEKVILSSDVLVKKFDSPVVALVSGFGGVVGVGCMDGTTYVLKEVVDGCGCNTIIGPIQTSKNHKKLVTGLSFNLDRKARLVNGDEPLLLASSSRDGLIHISKITPSFNDNDEESLAVINLHTYNTNNPIQCISFISVEYISVFVRDESFLRIYNTSTPTAQVKTITLNGERGSWDKHASFNVMAITTNPEDSMLLLATDKNRNILISLSPNTKSFVERSGQRTELEGKQIMNFYGHTNDAFANPRCSFTFGGDDGGGGGVIGNSQLENSVVLWDVTDGSKTLQVLGEEEERHKANVRDVVSCKFSKTVVSCSFDKTVRVWV